MAANLKQKLAIGFGLGIAVFIGLLLYGDVQEIGRLLEEFRWRLLPVILLLTFLSYVLRGVRFHYYLHQVGITDITLWSSIRVFIGGFSLSLTPGKLGEFVRVLWLKNLVGADPARVAPSIVVDRIVDGLAMATLASLGGLSYPQYWPLVGVIVAILVSGIIVIQIRPLAYWCLDFGEGLPFVSRFVRHLHILYESTYELLRLKNFLVGFGIGLVVWSIQGAALYLALIGLGITGSFNLMLLSIFTLAVGSLFGGASTSPGGLGATEASMAVILQAVVGISQNMAATATLLIRFFTLWFGVILGILTVAIWRKQLFGYGIEQLGLQIDEGSELTYEQTN